jgi:hypothetical protein
MHRIPLAAPLFALAACNGGASISIDGDNVSIHSNMAMDAANLDLDGIDLYPGSTVRDLRIDARDGKQGKDSGRVTVQFEAPASTDKVQTWFRDAVTKRGYAIATEQGGLTGTKAGGGSVTLELTAEGAGKSKGRLVVAE